MLKFTWRDGVSTNHRSSSLVGWSDDKLIWIHEMSWVGSCTVTALEARMRYINWRFTLHWITQHWATPRTSRTPLTTYGQFSRNLPVKVVWKSVYGFIALYEWVCCLLSDRAARVWMQKCVSICRRRSKSCRKLLTSSGKDVSGWVRN